MWHARFEWEWKIDCVMFVDDTALVAASEKGLQELLGTFGYVYKKRKLEMNVSKSMVMKICGNPEENTVNDSLVGRRMEEVKSYRGIWGRYFK